MIRLSKYSNSTVILLIGLSKYSKHSFPGHFISGQIWNLGTYLTMNQMVNSIYVIRSWWPSGLSDMHSMVKSWGIFNRPRNESCSGHIYFSCEITKKALKWTKKVKKRLKKMFRPGFGCCKHPKAGRNTQHRLISLYHTTDGEHLGLK